MELNKKNMRKIMTLITFTVLLLVGLLNVDVILNTINWIFGILMPFIIGGGIAFLLSVPLELFETKVFRKGKSDHKLLTRIRRPISILLSLLLIIGIILIVSFSIAPELTDTITKLASTFPKFIEKVEIWVLELAEKYPEIQAYINQYEFDLDKISGSIIDITSSIGSNIFSSTFSILGSIVNTLTNFVIGLVFAIYLLSQKEKLAQQGKKILYGYLPIKRADRIIVILKLTHKSFSNFISGQCVEAVIEGCIFFAVLSIFGFPYALLIGVLVGFTALIPIVGAFIGCIIGTLLLFMVSPVQALWFIVIFLILQQIESNLVYPYVVGGSIGLPSIWVLFAVTVGGSLMQVPGMLISIPLFSVFYVLLRENVKVRLMVRRIPEEKYKEPLKITVEQKRDELEQRENWRKRKAKERDKDKEEEYNQEASTSLDQTKGMNSSVKVQELVKDEKKNLTQKKTQVFEKISKDEMK